MLYKFPEIFNKKLISINEILVIGNKILAPNFFRYIVLNITITKTKNSIKK